MDIFRLVSAFKSSEVAEGADLYYANVTSALSIIKTALYLVMTVLSDLFMVRFVRILWLLVSPRGGLFVISCTVATLCGADPGQS